MVFESGTEVGLAQSLWAHFGLARRLFFQRSLASSSETVYQIAVEPVNIGVEDGVAIESPGRSARKDMAMSQMNEVLQHLCRTVLLRDVAGLTDGQLLEDFISRREEAALAALVRRQGPMVWGVCRRVLEMNTTPKMLSRPRSSSSSARRRPWCRGT
jgi:hypothetical protein